MNIKAYLLAAIVGGTLVVVFSPSLFFLIVEGDLPKTPLEKKVYVPQNYTIMTEEITVSSGQRLKNESIPIKTIGNNYQLQGEITANSSVTFMMFDDLNEFQKFLDGSSSYNAIVRVGLEPNVKQPFSKEIESGKSFVLELVFINSKEKGYKLDITLIASYLIEDVDIDYIPDLVRGILFPSLCVVGLIILFTSFIKLRRIMKTSYSPEKVVY